MLVLAGDIRQDRTGCGEGCVNVLVGVSGRDEVGLELAAGQVDAVVQHAAVVGGKSLGVIACRDVVAGDRFGVEEQREHAAHACDDVVESGVGSGLVESVHQP